MSEPAVTTTEDSILMKLKQIAQEHINLTPEQVAAIRPDAPIQEALRLDSLASVVLMSNVESEFGVSFEPEQWQEVHTVRDLVQMIQGAMAQEPRP